MKRIWKVLMCISIVFITGCTPVGQGNGGSGETVAVVKVEKKIVKLEAEFKENYQLWVDIKANGYIECKDYVKDMKSVATTFNCLGNKAKASGYKKHLNEEDQKIYETYRVLSDDIKDLAKMIQKNQYESAKELYQKILDAETELKE